MKLSEYREEYLSRSSKTSDIVRQLSFAGIGVIWIFRVQVGKVEKIPDELVLPTILFVISLGLDLLHAVIGTAIWGVYHRIKEKARRGNEKDPVLEHSPMLNWPILFFFWAKIIAVIIGYYTLITYLFDKLMS